MGEGLMADEGRDATFLLMGAGTWVGKLAYLTTDPMTIQEGKRAIAQAVSDNRVKARGPRYPCVNPPAQQPFWFNALRTFLQKMCLEIAVLTTSICYVKEIIFELISQENNITSLLGGNIFVTFSNKFPLHGKQYKMSLINNIVHWKVDKGCQNQNCVLLLLKILGVRSVTANIK